LRVLDTRETKVADLEIAILVDEDVAGFEITVDNTRRVYIFKTSLPNCQFCRILQSLAQTYQNLIEEVLDELLLKWSGGKEAMQIGA
jgi:hypothetical protein